MLAAGRNPGVFTSRQLDVPGVSDHRKGLVTAFLRSCGLLVRGGGRGVFRATTAARRIARAWDLSEALGRRELAIVLGRSWFAEIARQELGEHPRQRAALADRLLETARAPETRRGEVEILIMWLLEAQLLLPVSEESVVWNADAIPLVASDASEVTATREPREDATRTHCDELTVDSVLIDKSPRTSVRVEPGLTDAGGEPSMDGIELEEMNDSVVGPASDLDSHDAQDRSGTIKSFNSHLPEALLPEIPYTTADRAGIAEDEMLDSGHTPALQSAPDDGSSSWAEAIPPQTARTSITPPTNPTSQLATLVHLSELANQPWLHELLQLNEEELLSLHRGLRRFVDAAAGTRSSAIKFQPKAV
ncbi:hypothetical protein [Kitasatospora sp. MY 5-36]|uniref:hypothetical protein n=1 Tax=Kitasatospora sp. MY 5-36 TaxID=1678027 RepID=UPI00131B9044|nr:hypothetical protein [Kitasatospora sp. MY 5-36]